MSLQFGFFAQLTWGEYSWDIMEPVTYFTTCATLIGIYVYFALIRQVLNIICKILVDNYYYQIKFSTDISVYTIYFSIQREM